MTSDAVGATSVYYTPYQGNIVPIYNGANIDSYSFSQLTMALSGTNQLSGMVYDLFIFLYSGVVVIGAGPAWSSTTSRGTGSGTTQLAMVDGLWTNAYLMTLTNGTTTYSNIAVGKATYVGSVYMTANGQTTMQFEPAGAGGGTNNVLGLYNAYNRVLTSSRSIDATADWLCTTTVFQAANSSNNNRINWLDGLQQSFVFAEYQVQASCTTSGGTNVAYVAIGLDSTTSAQSSVFGDTVAATMSIRAASDILPQLGFHYVQALEMGPGGAGTYYFGTTTMHVKAILEM